MLGVKFSGLGHGAAMVEGEGYGAAMEARCDDKCVIGRGGGGTQRLECYMRGAPKPPILIPLFMIL